MQATLMAKSSSTLQHLTDGQVKFNITAFDLAGNNLTVNSNESKLFKTSQ